MIQYVQGIKVIINKSDLKLPHVIASYYTQSGIFSIRTGKLIKGDLSAEKVDQIENWIVLNDKRLMRLWESQNK